MIPKYVNLVQSKVIHNGSKSSNANWGKDKSRQVENRKSSTK